MKFNEIKQRLKGKKTIKVFKIQRWSSVGGFRGESAGWEVEKQVHFTKNKALEKVAKNKEFYGQWGPNPYNKYEVFNSQIAVEKLTIKTI